MLKLSKHIHNLPVMSLRTGGRVATALQPIINPHNLQIEGWRCEDSFSKDELILLKQDVRDFVAKGIAVDDHDVLAEAKDLVRLQEVLELGFELMGKHVVTHRRRKLGKVTDYALDPLTMKIQKLYVSRPVYRSLTEGQLMIDRSQIVEITPSRVVVRDTDVLVEAPASQPLTAAPTEQVA